MEIKIQAWQTAQRRGYVMLDEPFSAQAAERVAQELIERAERLRATAQRNSGESVNYHPLKRLACNCALPQFH